MVGNFLTAIALVVVLEGLLPAISPSVYRRTVMQFAAMPLRSIRIAGLAMMVAGAVMLQFIN